MKHRKQHLAQRRHAQNVNKHIHGRRKTKHHKQIGVEVEEYFVRNRQVQGHGDTLEKKGDHNHQRQSFGHNPLSLLHLHFRCLTSLDFRLQKRNMD